MKTGKNIDPKKLMLSASVKALMGTADKYANITMAKLKRASGEELKEELRKLGVPYYETDIKEIGKREMNENGDTYNPIVAFLNKDDTQKILIIKIDEFLRKKDLENLANLKIFCEIDGEGILPNTLTILDQKSEDLLKESIDRMNEDYKTKYNFIFHDIMYI